MARVTFNRVYAGVWKKIDGIVFYRWRGLHCMRAKGKNYNPRTREQQANRELFGSLSRAWRKLEPAHRERWDLRAEGKPWSGFNGFISENTKRLRAGLDMCTVPPEVPVTEIKAAVEAGPFRP
jgi:hypothetical protein